MNGYSETLASLARAGTCEAYPNISFNEIDRSIRGTNRSAVDLQKRVPAAKKHEEEARCNSKDRRKWVARRAVVFLFVIAVRIAAIQGRFGTEYRG